MPIRLPISADAHRLSDRGCILLSTDPTDRELCFAHQRAIQAVHGIVISYRIALIGPRIDVVHSELDPTLPEHSVRVRAGEAELMVDSADWIGHRAELDAHVFDWLLEHIDLRDARPRPGARRYDEVWMRAWRDANPGRW